MNFPQPKRIGHITRWSPVELMRWERSEGLELPPLAGLIDVKKLAVRYGVSVATVWRLAARSRAA